MLKNSIGVTAILFLAAAIGGVLCVVLPAFLSGITRSYDAPLFAVLRTSVENLRFLPTAISLFVLGVGLGLLNPNHWLVLAVGTVAVFPVAAILEMMVDPSSHNLWPIEFLVYAVLGIPSILGSWGGRLIAIRLRP
ncbi:MAG: hypothetical protein QME66_13825 [Candidatus Eisenbacteria bacterium]|nr:hypothetical protein [Candidatus Eisenbacteria bacterium]